jgi:hypothetical protein
VEIRKEITARDQQFSVCNTQFATCSSATVKVAVKVEGGLKNFWHGAGYVMRQGDYNFALGEVKELASEVALYCCFGAGAGDLLG